MMRAKMVITGVTTFDTPNSPEVLTMTAVSKRDGYGSDGRDEDNTFAQFTPSANLNITIANPDLLGKFKPGQVFYVDFSLAE